MRPAPLIERGWAGLACYPESKIPAWPRGVRDATCDPDRLTDWWRRHPHDNPAVACGPSGLVVVDLDRRPGVDGLHSFRQLCCAHETEWPDTFQVTTPHGRHLYFTGHAASSTGRHGPGVDVKAAGGYVLAPGSTIGGHAYEVAGDVAVLPVPDWLTTPPVSKASSRGRTGRTVDSDRARRWAAAALTAETRTVTRAAEGTRNSTLYLAALKLGSIIGADLLDEDQVAEQLTAAALEAGLEPGETARTVRSGIRNGLDHPRWPR